MIDLDDDGFAVFAEDEAQGVGYFADGGVAFDRIHNMGAIMFALVRAALVRWRMDSA